MDEVTAREPEEVFDDHLHQGQHGTVEEDLSRNYAPEVVVLTGAGVHRGHDGVRELAARLRQALPEASITYTARVVAGEVALLEWAASTPSGRGCRTGPTPSSSAAGASRRRPSTTRSSRRRPRRTEHRDELTTDSRRY
jgi:hypothetical protein